MNWCCYRLFEGDYILCEGVRKGWTRVNVMRVCIEYDGGVMPCQQNSKVVIVHLSYSAFWSLFAHLSTHS